MGRAKEIIKKQGIIYLAIAVFSTLLSIFSLNFANMPKGEEIFTIFIGSYSSNIDEFKGVIEANKPDYVRKVAINSFRNDDDNFLLYYNSFGLKHSDMIIIPESKIKKEDLVTYCIALPDSVVEKYGYTSTFDVDDYSYGVKLFDIDNKIDSLLTLSKEGVEKEDYFMFFKKKSYHTGSLGEGKKELAFDYARLLYNYGKES